MGSVANISAESFPKQSKHVGRQVEVCFHYDTSKIVNGLIVRDDVEEPGVMIILLDDRRLVLATECMYAFA